jgi:hypothetical protein
LSFSNSGDKGIKHAASNISDASKD